MIVATCFQDVGTRHDCKIGNLIKTESIIVASAEDASTKAMKELTRRILLAMGAGSVVILVYTLGYRWGMATFEGEQLSFIRSLQVVLEALTTAGFGGDAPWSTPEMNLLIITMNLTGVSFVFFGIPFFIIPLLKDAVTPEIPTETALTDHVIVYTDSLREPAHREGFVDRDEPVLFLKRDADEVQTLRQDDIEVIQGNPETSEALENANARGQGHARRH